MPTTSCRWPQMGIFLPLSTLWIEPQHCMSLTVVVHSVSFCHSLMTPWQPPYHYTGKRVKSWPRSSAHSEFGFQHRYLKQMFCLAFHRLHCGKLLSHFRSRLNTRAHQMHSEDKWYFYPGSFVKSQEKSLPELVSMFHLDLVSQLQSSCCSV